MQIVDKAVSWVVRKWDDALDYAWEWIVKGAFRAVLIALAVGFLVGAIAAGSTARHAYSAAASHTSTSIEGVAPLAALEESLPQAAVHSWQHCSIVVIRPNVAVTAAHCWDSWGGSTHSVVAKDGRKVRVTGGLRSQNSDVAIIYLEDLGCPCAPLASGSIRKGEDTLVIGYPMGRYVPSVKGVALEVNTGAALLESVLGPKPEDEEWPIEAPHSLYLWQSGQLIGGHSGGGMFVRRDGEWRLVAVNSWAYPPLAQFFFGAPSGGAGAIMWGTDLHDEIFGK